MYALSHPAKVSLKVFRLYSKSSQHTVECNSHYEISKSNNWNPQKIGPIFKINNGYIVSDQKCCTRAIYEFPSYLRWRIADKIKLNLCKSPDHLNFTLFRFEEYLLNLIKP